MKLEVGLDNATIGGGEYNSILGVGGVQVMERYLVHSCPLPTEYMTGATDASLSSWGAYGHSMIGAG